MFQSRSTNNLYDVYRLHFRMERLYRLWSLVRMRNYLFRRAERKKNHVNKGITYSSRKQPGTARVLLSGGDAPTDAVQISLVRYALSLCFSPRLRVEVRIHCIRMWRVLPGVVSLVEGNAEMEKKPVVLVIIGKGNRSTRNRVTNLGSTWECCFRLRKFHHHKQNGMEAWTKQRYEVLVSMFILLYIDVNASFSYKEELAQSILFWQSVPHTLTDAFSGERNDR